MKDKYVVEDEDPGDEFEPNPIRKQFTLVAKSLIQLRPADHDFTENEFAKGSLVLTMFPKTTSFYCAMVLGGPRKRKAPEYVLKFEDDDEENGITKRIINARYVIKDPASLGS